MNFQSSVVERMSSNRPTTCFQVKELFCFRLLSPSDKLGRGDGTSVRAVAFSQSKLGSNPGTDLAFSVQRLLRIYSRWALGFSK